MDGYIVQGAVGMPRGSLLRIEDGAGLLVYVWEGELWLTQEGSREDHMLGAGRWFRVDRQGAAIAYACRRSVVSLSSPQPGSPARAITLAKPGSRASVVLHRRGRLHAWHALRARLASLLSPHPTTDRI
jgi:hypothetical protein